MNPFAWSFRAQFALGAAICAALLGFALYSQHGSMALTPCPLCILQRLAFAAMGTAFLLGAVYDPMPRTSPIGQPLKLLRGVFVNGWRKFIALIVWLFAMAGAGVAAWHVRMQHLPASEVPSCSSMDLSYMLDAFPLQKVIEKVFTGSGECAQVDWAFLGISMPGWTLIWYLILGIAALWAGFRRRA